MVSQLALSVSGVVRSVSSLSTRDNEQMLRAYVERMPRMRTLFNLEYPPWYFGVNGCAIHVITHEARGDTLLYSKLRACGRVGCRYTVGNESGVAI